MLTVAKNEPVYTIRELPAMENVFTRNLEKNADLVAAIFDKDMNDVVEIIETLYGTSEEMLAQFFIGLHIPMNQQNYKIVSSIANRDRTFSY